VSTSDRFGDQVDEASGKTKEWAGKATGDRDLEREGQVQHGVAETKETARDVGEKVKDAVSDAAQKVKDTFRR
jgi:uncharacterized protein YjbJ (UPF0337 family)